MDGSCEISPSVGKFYAQFNNIMAVLGKYNNDMAAVHLTNSYCVLSLLYACEIWSLSDSRAHSVRVAINNEGFLTVAGERTQSLCCFIVEPCQLCPQLTSVVLSFTRSCNITVVLPNFANMIFCQLWPNMVLIGWIILPLLSRSPCGRRLLHLLYRFLVFS